MSTLPWNLLPVFLALAWLAGLAFAQPGERTGRSRYAFWILWAGVIYPAGAILLLAGAGPDHAPLWWTYVALYLGQVFVLGAETSRRLADAGRSRWLGLPVGIPFLGLVPAACLLLQPKRDGVAQWRARRTVGASANA